MLELTDVHSAYGDTYVVRGVSLKVTPGTVVALLGRNGMGKTTLVHTIMGLVPVRAGKISFDKKDITNLPPQRISPLGLSLVPQGRRIFPSLSVRENLALGMRGKGWTLEGIYSLFPVLEKRASNKGNRLSGGEQQMLAIARAMLANPEIILMDEPSEGLAPIVIESIGDVIVELKKQGLSILLVEQNVPLALSVSDYVYILHKGRIVHQCATPELVENEAILTEYIGVSKI
ncbi:MAG: ABC transporter ATP-binding protein [Syntrophorhabdales bacterium]|jgi:branched-chain amino acid transport system ATP-binding protein